MIEAAPQTVVIYSDIGCPWAHLAVARLHRVRAELGLGDLVRFDHRAFVLELANERPTPRQTLDAEIPVVGALEPDAGWQVWSAGESTWPVTMLPALEAVQAAKEQGLVASEVLDLGLRRALFAESRCISMRHVILEVAEGCDGVDANALAAALDDGRARRAVIDQHVIAECDDVKGSPHVFASGGMSVHNPGVRMHWHHQPGRGFPIVEADEPGVYREILERAASG